MFCFLQRLTLIIRTNTSTINSIPPSINSLRSSEIDLSLEEIRKHNEQFQIGNPFFVLKNRFQIYRQIQTGKFERKINNVVLLIYHLNKYPFALNLISDKINGDIYPNMSSLKLILLLCKEKIKEEDVDSIFDKYLLINGLQVGKKNIIFLKSFKSLIYGTIKKKHSKSILYQIYKISKPNTVNPNTPINSYNEPDQIPTHPEEGVINSNSRMYSGKSWETTPYFTNYAINPTIILFPQFEIPNNPFPPLKTYKTIFLKTISTDNRTKERQEIEKYTLKSCFMQIKKEYIVLKRKGCKYKIYRVGTVNEYIRDLSELPKCLNVTINDIFDSVRLLVYANSSM